MKTAIALVCGILIGIGAFFLFFYLAIKRAEADDKKTDTTKKPENQFDKDVETIIKDSLNEAIRNKQINGGFTWEIKTTTVLSPASQFERRSAVQDNEEELVKLEAQLKLAVETENYELAIKIRNRINEIKNK